jgi:REP element-mobilizing transposase RayT
VTHNEPGTPFDRDWPNLREAAKRKQRGPRVVLSRAQAALCFNSFMTTSDDYGLQMLSVAIMPTHVHVLVRSPNREGARLLNLFKGAASRRLSLRFGKPEAGTWWTRSGLHRLVLGSGAVRSAATYVRDQEHPLLLWMRER